MKLEVFKTIIETIETQGNKSMEAVKLGIDLLDHDEGWLVAIALLMNSYYGKEGGDWVNWYLYERPLVESDGPSATDKDGNAICYDIPSLWKHVEEIRVSENFEEYELPKKTNLTDGDILRLLTGKR